MKKFKDIASNAFLVLVMIVGLSLLLYPTVSDYWNSKVQSYAVKHYQDEVAVLDQEKYDEIWNAAIAYNQSLAERDNMYRLDISNQLMYNNMLNLGGNGIMGYVEIPAIQVNLPLYHGTSEPILQIAIGHLDWTSLPTGGESTHCVVSGHRGLPSARLFTDLDQLMVGDIFMLHVLDEVLTYEVDQIKIVEPQMTEDLLIQQGKDLVTLVTCTPYGVNSHRMLVRGHRVENIEDAPVVRVTADAVIVEKLLVAPFLLAPILLLMLIYVIIPKPKHDRRNEN